MSPLVTALINIFGPMFAAIVKKLLERWLGLAAETHGETESTPVTLESATALIDTAIAHRRRFQVGAKNLLRGMKRSLIANPALLTDPNTLHPDQKAELQDLAAAAENEV